MVRGVRPPPDTVTTPLRLAVPVFAVALTAKLPLFEPLAGDTEIQLWSSVTVQPPFEVTVTVDEEAVAANDSDVGAIVSCWLPPAGSP